MSQITPKMSQAYIYDCLAQATIQDETVFTSRVPPRITKVAQGVPKTLHVPYTSALIVGFWAQQRPVSARIAREAIAQVQDCSPSQVRCWWSWV